MKDDERAPNADRSSIAPAEATPPPDSLARARNWRVRLTIHDQTFHPRRNKFPGNAMEVDNTRRARCLCGESSNLVPVGKACMSENIARRNVDRKHVPVRADRNDN